MTRCLCAECVVLDELPERLQGIPGAVQLKLPIAKRKKRTNAAAKSKT